MNLSRHPRLNRSVSCFAIAASIGVLLVSSLSVSAVKADEITYGGSATDVSKLRQDPTGDTAAATTYKSLYVDGVYTGNTITVDGGTGGNGQAQWNTGTSPSTPVAPYVIYGGVSVGADGTTASSLKNNIIALKNIQYDWAGKSATTGMDGTSATAGYGGGVGGMGGGSVFGGLSIGGSGYSNAVGSGGSVTGNTVTLNNVTLTGASGGNGGLGGADDGGGGAGGMGGGSVFGGLSIGGAGGAGYGGVGGEVSGNTVNLANVTLTGAFGGDGGGYGLYYGGGGVGGMGGGSIFGGLSIGGAGGGGAGGVGGEVTDNTLTLINVILTGASGGSGGNGSFSNGKAINGMDGGGVFGGVSIGGAGGNDEGGNGGNVSDNEVVITGNSLIWSDIYGGYSVGGASGSSGSTGSGGLAINNTVTLEGSDIKIGERDADGNVTTYGSIYGGYSVNGDGTLSSADVFTGNTLNLVGYRGTVSGIYNFENYNWTLPSDVKNGDVLVTIADGGTAVDLTNTKHTVADMQVSDNRLKDNDTVTFINKTQGTWVANSPYTIKQGQFIVYDATLTQQSEGDEALVLTVNRATDNTPTDNGGGNGGGGSAAKVNPQSKSYSEGRAAALGFVNQGSDLIATAGIDHIRIMVRANEDSLNRPAFIPFMIANGSSQRYKTGSHVDIDGFNMAVGLATGFDFAAGHKATVGAFFEYGRGTYDTYNSFTNFASVHGDGDSNYKGGGIFGRIDFAGTGLGRVRQLAADQADGLYVEASLRAGRAKSEFDVGRNADVLGNFTGVYRGSYDSSVTYYGGHVAGGYVFNFDERQALDIYGRYLWTHMDGDDVSVANEPLHFDSSLSSRIQLGGRYAYAYSEQFKPYIGAAYEYEFDGEVKATAYEFNLDRPSLEGSTGIFEAGFSLQPIASNKALSLDVNGQAYAGQRQGGGGGIKLKYQF